MALDYIEYYTYEDYKNWEGDWELIEGHPVAMAPAPVIKHQSIATKIAAQLEMSIQECEEYDVVMEEDYKISDDTIVRPDVSFICDKNSESYIIKPPLIIAEIISPSTIYKDERVKFELYEKEGVKYYILVYPEDLRAKIFKNSENGFKKIGDFFTETFCFEDIACKPCIDFARVFKKWRTNRHETQRQIHNDHQK